MKQNKIKLLAFIIAALFLSSCSLTDMAIAAHGTDGPITKIPASVRNFSLQQDASSITLYWDGPEKSDIMDAEGFSDAAKDIIEEEFGTPDAPKGYEILRRSSLDGVIWTAWDTIAIISDSSAGFIDIDEIAGGNNQNLGFFNYTDKNIAVATFYQYKIAAYNGAGPSAYDVSNTIEPLYNHNLVPQNFNAVLDKQDGLLVMISWDEYPNCSFVVERGIRDYSPLSGVSFESITWKNITPQDFTGIFITDELMDLPIEQQIGISKNGVYYRAYLIHTELGSGSYTDTVKVSLL